MAEHSVRYAKLASPRLHGALPRRRLFALLDQMRAQHQVLWISGPPGAGKSTLAASYLAQAGAPAHWCQIDQGDADPATLFFFLAEAIKDSGPALSWQTLPPEMRMAGVERFFFRDFYARLPQGAVLVLDNIQEFDWTSAGALMEAAFSEVPDGINVLAISRDSPPARLARMTLDGRLATIGWDALRLDDEEAHAMAQWDDDPGAGGAGWLELVDGWVAGLVMLRSLRKQASSASVPLLDGRDAVFRYFAGEIFERMDPAARHLLLLLSCLPGITAADAEQLTGDARAPRLLDELYRDRLFVERRGAAVTTYHFHALFREYLQHEARLRLDAGERRQLLERAARILGAHGRIDEAAQLFQDAGAHAALAALLRDNASAMLDAGRGQSWREWMSTLPPDQIEQQPWLWYWHGVSLIEVTPIRARQLLGRASKAFLELGDTLADLRTQLAMVDSYDVEWADFRALPATIDSIAASVAALDLDSLDPALDLKIHSRLTLAMLLAAPEAPTLGACAARALRVLPQVENPVEQLAAGAILLRHCDGSDMIDTAHWLVGMLNKLADDPAISPFHRVRWYSRVAGWYNQDGHYDQAEEMTGSARRIVDSFGLDPLLFQFLEVHHMLGSGELAAARTLLDQCRGLLSPARKRDQVQFSMLDANWRALSGDVPGALAAAREGVRISAEAGLPTTERARYEAFVAGCLALGGQFAQADQWYHQAGEHAFGHEAGLIAEARQCVQAYACSVEGRHQEAESLLRSALEGHRKRQATTLFAMQPQIAALVAALALQHAIEPEHIGALIVRQRLQAPPRCGQNWPWPLALRTLGSFQLSLHGTPVASSGKAQQRPLLLLKALSAAPGGKQQHSLAAQLWPDAADAKAALSVTVHRLRKLLKSDDAVLVTAGKIQLAEDNYWSDLAALGALCEQVERLPAMAAPADLQRLGAELLSLYRGPFCDGDDDHWMLPIREQWRNRFLGACAALGQQFETQLEWSSALTLYQRALEAEPLAETSYRGMMRCFHACGDPAAAFSAYRRCRDTLSVVLGRQPSAETEKLATTLALRASGQGAG